MKLDEIDNLGEPTLKIAGLRVWIHGRQYPEASDYWDGNWLRVTACCNSEGSVVFTSGPIVRVDELGRFLSGCQHLYTTLLGSAVLDCLEPNLRVELTAQTLGKIEVRLSITPDQIAESHTYIDFVDQTYLPALMASCRAVLNNFPLREPEQFQR